MSKVRGAHPSKTAKGGAALAVMVQGGPAPTQAKGRLEGATVLFSGEFYSRKRGQLAGVFVIDKPVPGVVGFVVDEPGADAAVFVFVHEEERDSVAVAFASGNGSRQSPAAG